MARRGPTPSGLLSGSSVRSDTHALPRAATRLPWALAAARPHFATAAPAALCWEPRSPCGSEGPRPERCSDAFDNLGQGPMWTDPRGAVGATHGLAESSDLSSSEDRPGVGLSLLPPCLWASAPSTSLCHPASSFPARSFTSGFPQASWYCYQKQTPVPDVQ